MTVYLVTGRLGSGKSLAAVGRMVDYLRKGRRVVANFHVDVSSVCITPKERLSRGVVEVIPDRPNSQVLLGLGRGGPSEHEAGLLVLDECATFLNSRQWSGQDRAAVVDWFLHTRKLGWDVILIVQHQSMLDKQLREAICEYLVVVKRADKLRLPVIGWIAKVSLPRFHIAFVRYGMEPTAPIAERWIYRGNSLFAAYDTRWLSDATMAAGHYSVLPATLSRWRYRDAPWPRLAVWAARLFRGLFHALATLGGAPASRPGLPPAGRPGCRDPRDDLAARWFKSRGLRPPGEPVWQRIVARP